MRFESRRSFGSYKLFLFFDEPKCHQYEFPKTMNRFLMMMWWRSAVGMLVVSVLPAHAATNSIPYQVSLQRLAPGSGTLGFATIFTEYNTTSTWVGYAGILEGVEPNLLAKTCNATNGCGVHIHNGTACTNTTTQGGHYWVKTGTVTVDPWINARYSSDSNGTANFQGVLDIGTTDVNGRVFIGTWLESSTACFATFGTLTCWCVCLL
jgi:hypothetical protein